ncbi:Disease resistance protein RGA2 [Rhynchospora pubera]|uniref:Disease resistance protein RGA2 n=1 Tax=Rhynchospora pubera TaxID=906938 RepID=A0AAV8FU78_9POAL|nr:Disease resistance protein RGA2 [Rhynchospora pubera]
MAWDLGGENVKSKLIDDLYDKAKSLVEDHLLWDNEFEEQLDNLHRQLPMVEAVLTAMDNDGLGLREKDRLDKWSWQFRDALEAAEDVLDEIDYNKVEDELLHSTRGVLSRDAKCQEHEKLLKSHEDAGLEVEQVVFGRGSEKQEIIDWLKKREDENTQSNGGNNIHAYAIVGIGGMGKTTLARLVYNDAELREVEDYRQLFNRHAFAGSNPELHEDLKIIGGDIAKKLGGCPLAAKVLGGHLNQNKQEYYWDKILKEDIRVNADTSEHGFKAILRLSYQNLPTNLQRCFKFCSIFPEDYAFEKDELIYMWIGLGLLPDKNPRLEDIGREYIDYLLRKSFFDIKESNGSTPCIVMHDLLHDLGRSLSIEECFTIGDGLDSNINFPEMIRHLYISADAKDYSLFTRIAQLKKLRTLIIVFKGGDPDENHVPLLAEILTELKSLRVLSLTASFSYGYKVTELKNLTGIRELSISQLEKVGCSESEAREVNLFKKENLRSLNLVWSMDPTRAPESDERIADVICPPTRLRELTIKGYNGKRFPLWMKFFSDKTYYLTCISLLGCKNWSDLPDLAYLPLLKTLQIKDVSLVSISKLFKAASSRTEASSSSSSPRTSSSLEILKIKYCQELKSIQPDGFKNMHSLKILIMGDCPNLTISGANAELLPPKLEHLSIGPCENLEIPILNSLLNAHSLKYLSFENCTTITTLPSTDVFATLTVLTSLKIKSCTALESLGGLEAAPSLHSLTIFGCNQLIRVSSSQLQSNGYTNQVGTRNTNSMSMLKFLNIDTESLMSIKPLRKLTTVEEIKIVNASNANPWQDLEVTMRSLKRLYLCNATWVVSLPRFLTSLQSLHICGCDAAFLQQHQNGAWSTIGSVEFCKDQCSYQKLFMSDLEFDRSDLA